jgi:hypothetical protein
MAARIYADGSAGEPFWLVSDPPESVEGFAKLRSSNDAEVAETAARINAHLSMPANWPAWEFRRCASRTTADDGHILCEPCVYRRPDGVLVQLWRDSNHSHRVYVCYSTNKGAGWTTPTATDIRDAGSKIIAGTLPEGRVYIIGNFVSEPFNEVKVPHYPRDPLVIVTSADGVRFDYAAAFVTGSPDKARLGGRGKGRGFQYPHAIVVGDDLWVIYSITKEDIAITRVPVETIKPRPML